MLLNLRRVRCSFHIIFLMHCRFFNSLLLPFLFNVKVLVQSQLHQHPGFLSKLISPRGKCVIFSILLSPPALCGKGIHGPAQFRMQQRTANSDYQRCSQHQADLSRMAETSNYRSLGMTPASRQGQGAGTEADLVPNSHLVLWLLQFIFSWL